VTINSALPLVVIFLLHRAVAAMHVRSWAVLAAILLLMFVCAEDVRAAPGSNGKPAKFDFSDCGGAKACLGVARLERLRKRSGKMHYGRFEGSTCA